MVALRTTFKELSRDQDTGEATLKGLRGPKKKSVERLPQRVDGGFRVKNKEYL